MPQVTVSQAALLTKKSRQTINKLTKNGGLAVSLNTENAKVIDYSELVRVFPDAEPFENLEKLEDQTDVPEQNFEESGQVAILKVQLAAAERERDMIKAERERERDQFEAQIETLTKALEQGGVAMKLLADQSAQKTAGDEEMKTLKKAVRRVIQDNKILREESAKSGGAFGNWFRKGQSGKQLPANAADRTG